MSTSGSTNFNLTTNQIIQETLELIGVLSSFETASGEDYSTCLKSLNIMIKAWQNKGIMVTTETEGTVFLVKGQPGYQLGGSGPAKASGTNTVETYLTEAETSGDTLMHVASTSGMTAGDNIGVQLDDGDLFWTTIATVNSATTVTLSAAIDDDATSGFSVFSYTAAIGRPLHISSVRLRKSGSTTSPSASSDYLLTELSRKNYYNIPNKFVQGLPVQYYFDRQATQTTLYVYLAPNQVADRLKVTYRRVIEDFDNTVDVADLDPSWLGAIVYNLAVNVSPKYSKEMKVASIDFGIVKQKAIEYLDDAISNAQEKTSLRFRPRLPF